MGKVARLLAKYDLDGFGEDLERFWTANGSERKSLRDLAALFNERLVSQVMADAGIQPVDGEAENVRRLLSDEDPSTSDRIRMRRRLERDGVDVDALESDFVSYQAIRTYLKDHRDVEYTADSEGRLERDMQSIQQLGSRFETIAHSKLERLNDAGRISLGDFRVMNDMVVLCEDCGAHQSVGVLIDEEGCDCEDD